MLVLLFSAFLLILNCREVAIDFSSDEKYEEFIRNSCEKHCLVHNHQVVDNIHRFTFDDSAGKKRNVQFDEVIQSLQNSGLILN
jgi:hypothetical protein